MKRLVLNMVCGSPDSGKALVYPDRRDLCEVGRASQGSRAESSSIPLFLGEVGKYYWNRKMTYREYPGLCTIESCIKNNHQKILDFLITEITYVRFA
jgi:hypothetical protein